MKALVLQSMPVQIFELCENIVQGGIGLSQMQCLKKPLLSSGANQYRFRKYCIEIQMSIGWSHLISRISFSLFAAQLRQKLEERQITQQVLD